MLNNSRIILLSLTLLAGIAWFASIDDGLSENGSPNAVNFAIDSPRLELSFYRGRLAIDGHATSHDQEQRLKKNAARLFRDAPTSASFRPLAAAPDHWADVSIMLLEALSATQSGNALLVDDTVRIRGVGSPDWSETALRLRAALPASIDLDVDVIVADNNVSARDMCEQAFAEFRTDPINFEESTTVLRQSAQPALDRAVSLADACRGSLITVTGHTDASGPEDFNRILSLARADAVADYLKKGGVERSRIVTVGAGSSQPLATNASRYGRGLNRRIDIRFRWGS